ncbi:DNA-binding response regulator, OmpR family, contains REC and winged-helix (wHTH) domain [Anaerosporobacter mobilis DSM 15930]|jgi:DNA-binding response OmpR family regulator|uniref:Stage 0 sporulation protein A homolog n=1 Tax=Anaerosporobacter mobilis DSM 15930 TaxID=1120996 RepID=A0A1M7LF52_9FIRM|nr:response regulator transcription factor [Anaerosporobacter mobilis]MBS5932270.1 response regulator transcription factor [Clostridiales bacterium]SHM76766.1 DNA-binding response regulator, OmpR family, contains REC and winged-helix (wHTH) domain [Anaerosporobacter mobilis DSM 15930]
MANILIVDDEESINELVKLNLKLVGHTCDQAYDGREALDMVTKGPYDLILLDVMLPFISGFDLMKKIKETPVIFMTAKDRIEDKIQGLTSGAEDYLVKPFEILELIARINIVLRRTKTENTVFKLVDMEMDREGKVVRYRNKEIDLTPQEYCLLEVFVINQNLALSREKLLELAWGYEYEGDTRTVDVHVQKLRKKLGLEERIKTVYKVGYRLEV